MTRGRRAFLAGPLLALLAAISMAGCASTAEPSDGDGHDAHMHAATPAGPEPGSIYESHDLATTLGSPIPCALDAYFDPTFFELELEGITYDAAILDPESGGHPYELAFGSTLQDRAGYWYIVEFLQDGETWFEHYPNIYAPDTTQTGVLPEHPLRIVVGTCVGGAGEATFTSYVPGEGSDAGA